MNKYFKTFPGIKRYINECQAFVDEHGWISDMVGRKRWFRYAGREGLSKEEIDEKYWGFRDKESGLWVVRKEFRKDIGSDRRAATNFPIQALAASMTKIGCNELHKSMSVRGLDSKIVNYIHDEALVAVRRDHHTIQQVLECVREAMVDHINMPKYCVPHPLGWTWPDYLDMDVDIKVGDSYGKMSKPKDYLKSLDSEE